MRARSGKAETSLKLARVVCLATHMRTGAPLRIGLVHGSSPAKFELHYSMYVCMYLFSLREAEFHRAVFSEYPLLDPWYELMRPLSILRRVAFLCHLLKRVSLAFPRMMVLSSSGKCACLRRYSSCSTHISFLPRASNLIGGTPESTFAASICMYICMYICIYVYMYACMYV